MFILKLVNVTDVTGVNMKLQCLNDVTDIEDELSDEAKVYRLAEMFGTFANLMVQQLSHTTKLTVIMYVETNLLFLSIHEPLISERLLLNSFSHQMLVYRLLYKSVDRCSRFCYVYIVM